MSSDCMQLSCIKISNILSFPYVEDRDSMKGICFDDDKDHDVNVFIGPNGSGKSNFLEVVNQVFKVGLYKDFVLHTGDDGKSDFSIEEKKQYAKYLQKHFSFSGEASSVMLRLQLCEQDYVSLERVMGQKSFFLRMIADYSDVDVIFPELSDFRAHKTIDLEFRVDTDAMDIVLESCSDPCWQFYLQYFELFQLCLVLWNHYLVDLPRSALPDSLASVAPVSFSLHGNFATLGASRGFSEHSISTKVSRFSGPDLDNLVYSQDTKKHGQLPIGFFLCKKMLLEHHESQSSDLSLAVLDGLSLDEQLVLAKSHADYHSNFYEMLRYYIKSYSSYDMVSFVQDGQIVLFFVDVWDNFYRINELSSGEQSFLYIIFTLFGYGLENGVLLIDEPEMHLHPQKQEDMLSMLEEIAHQYHIQVLMATHSPLMITENTISHVYRLHWNNQGTHVHTAGVEFNAYESNLIQMLQYGYTAKIFFVQKILMVEGDTDEYFFDYYLRYLRDQGGWDQIENFAVINVNGKGGYKAWNKFLAKFGIESYFLGDWDNIIDTGFQIKFSSLWNEQREDYFARKGKTLSDGRRRHWKKSYGYLVEFIEKKHPDLYARINAHIANLYEKDVFVLRHGDLERYLGLPIKGLDETVRFCHTQFADWLKDSRFREEREELEGIFGDVFGE